MNKADLKKAAKANQVNARHVPNDQTCRIVFDERHSERFANRLIGTGKWRLTKFGNTTYWESLDLALDAAKKMGSVYAFCGCAHKAPLLPFDKIDEATVKANLIV